MLLWYPLTDEAIANFDQITPISNVVISRFGVYLKTYEIAIGQNYKPKEDRRLSTPPIFSMPNLGAR